jgi:hypothetical protein
MRHFILTVKDNNFLYRIHIHPKKNANNTLKDRQQSVEKVISDPYTPIPQPP